MSAPTLIRRELLSVAFLAFIPKGETVDAVVVSETTWPDNVPTTNWTNYQIKDVEKLKVAKEYDTETFKIPNVSTGGYLDDDQNTLKSVKFDGETHMNYNYFTQLEHGLVTAPAVGVPQTPYAASNDYIEGVSLAEYMNSAGVIVKREQMWSRMRLTDPGETGPATRLKSFQLERRPSGNNTFEQIA